MSAGAPDEFDLIARLFAPLAQSYAGALGLGDDAALMDVPAGQQLVLTMDSMVAGVHFFADDPPDLIARKLVRVNLSDLAAKGAKPFAIMLAAAFPQGTDEAWLTGFGQGLAMDTQAFSLALIGGDTVATPGPLTLTVTAFGLLPHGQARLRSGARPGDDIWFSGTVGDSALGLWVRQGRMGKLAAGHRQFLERRYLLPQPRLGLAEGLRSLAHAAMDVSDGLVQDLGHLCRQSAVAAEILVADLPLSAAAQAALEDDPSCLAALLGGGDDYEILFTAPAEHKAALLDLAEQSGIALRIIGRITAGQGVRVLDRQGQTLAIEQAGWRHFKSAGGQ